MMASAPSTSAYLPTLEVHVRMHTRLPAVHLPAFPARPGPARPRTAFAHMCTHDYVLGRSILELLGESSTERKRRSRGVALDKRLERRLPD